MTSIASQLAAILAQRPSIDVTFRKGGNTRTVVGETQAYRLISADAKKPVVRPIDPMQFTIDGALDLRGISVVHVQNDVLHGTATVRQVVSRGFRGAFLVHPRNKPAIVVLTDEALLAEAHKRAKAMRAQTAEQVAAAQRAREERRNVERQRRRAQRKTADAVVPTPVVLNARPTDYWTEIAIVQGPAAISLEPVHYKVGDSIMTAYPALTWSSALNQKENVFGVFYCDSAKEAQELTQLTLTELSMLLGEPASVN